MSFLGILINGKRFDHSSVEIAFDGIPIVNVQDINWSESLEPGIERGTSALKLGRTRGMYDADGSVTMSKGAARDFKRRLLLKKPTSGYGEIEFGVSLTYFEELPDEEPILVELLDVRITKADDATATGGENLQTTFALNIMQIKEDGMTMVAPRGGASFGGLIFT